MPFVLSFHAGYRCRDAGVCCTSGWPIPIEDDCAASLASASLQGRLTTAPPIVRLEKDEWVLTVVNHACVFHGASVDRGCGIQRALGHAALPLACRQFPRVSVRDPRGMSVTLSHYCPTAAAMLGGALPAIIVESPAGFPADGEYIGLDADGGLPPRLRPDMLMDWESWWTWERLSVAALATAPDAARGLARIHAAVEHVRTWRPDDGALGDRIVDAFGRSSASREITAAETIFRRDEVLDGIPAERRPRETAALSARVTPAILRDFLIAHAFANWTAHLGEGLRTWLRSLDAAHALVGSGLSVSTANLWLRHLVDPAEMAERWSEAERG